MPASILYSMALSTHLPSPSPSVFPLILEAFSIRVDSQAQPLTLIPRFVTTSEAAAHSRDKGLESAHLGHLSQRLLPPTASAVPASSTPSPGAHDHLSSLHWSGKDRATACLSASGSEC